MKTKEDGPEKPSDYEWRSIPGYDGYYEVDEIGRIWSCRYNKLMICCELRGYLSVTLRKDDKPRRFQVSRLVGMTFIGCEDEKLHICHKDGNPQNNHWSNLYYGTPYQNYLDRKKHGRFKPGTRGGLSNLTNEDVLAIREIRATQKISHMKLAEMYSVSDATISHITTRKTWRHI